MKARKLSAQGTPSSPPGADGSDGSDGSGDGAGNLGASGGAANLGASGGAGNLGEPGEPGGADQPESTGGATHGAPSRPARSRGRGTSRSSPPSARADSAWPSAHNETDGEVAPMSSSGSDLTPVVGANLRRFRTERDLSLERLSRASGVSRAMLGQIELGQSAPTINVLWKIARALGVPFSALISQQSAPGTTVLPAARAKTLRSHDGSFSSRALFPMDRPRNVEFYELRLAPLAAEHADPHPPGTIENLIVNAGTLEMTVGSDRRLLATGDAILFEADVPHTYRNPGTAEVVMYLVMTYAERV